MENLFLHADWVALNAQAHRGLRLSESAGRFALARRCLDLPLALAELPHACLDYPCLFRPAGEGHQLVALLGLRQRENLFVDAQGRWEAGRWLPALAHAYPFALADDGQSFPHGLQIDRRCAALQRWQGEALYTDSGAPAPLLRQVWDHLAECQQELRRSRGLAGRLAALGLLVPHRIDYDAGSVQGHLGGFFKVDEARLAALPAADLLQLHASGDLADVQAHLLSLNHVPRLAHRLAQAPVRAEDLRSAFAARAGWAADRANERSAVGPHLHAVRPLLQREAATA